MSNERGAGAEQVTIEVESASADADDAQLAAAGLRRPTAEDDVANHGAMARMVLIDSHDPRGAVVFCRAPGCTSKLSRLGDVDYRAEGGPVFASAYGDVRVPLPVVAQCACCGAESRIVDMRREN